MLLFNTTIGSSNISNNIITNKGVEAEAERRQQQAEDVQEEGLLQNTGV